MKPRKVQIIPLYRYHGEFYITRDGKLYIEDKRRKPKRRKR